jgi:hypothetical protein
MNHNEHISRHQKYFHREFSMKKIEEISFFLVFHENKYRTCMILIFCSYQYEQIILETISKKVPNQKYYDFFKIIL